MTIYIPSTIRIGFQSRSDTYTQKLAYVIYFDEKNHLRKQKSWDTWRDKKISFFDYHNDPTPGFVLNKKVGGNSTGWNHRQTYVRIFDPRGFEFEITIPNLLYVLENTSSIKGKGLDGEFVYGWDGADLLLIPTSSPDYPSFAEYSASIRHPEKILSKSLIPGATYRTNKNEDYIYLGKFPEYGTNTYDDKTYGINLGNRYFFEKTTLQSYIMLRSISGRIVQLISPTPIPDYAERMDALQHKAFYSPIDETKDTYTPYTSEELQQLEETQRWISAYIEHNNEILLCTIRKIYLRDRWSLSIERKSTHWGTRHTETIYDGESLVELNSRFSLLKLTRYLENGNEYKG